MKADEIVNGILGHLATLPAGTETTTVEAIEAIFGSKYTDPDSLTIAGERIEFMQLFEIDRKVRDKARNKGLKLDSSKYDDQPTGLPFCVPYVVKSMADNQLSGLKKLHLVSNSVCYGPCPKPEDEIEQRLTINSKGRVWFSSYAYGDGFGKYVKIESRTAKIDVSVAENILSKVSDYFFGDCLIDIVTDVGTWELELTDATGTVSCFGGPLCSSLLHQGEDLSMLIREGLGMSNLYVFDGNADSEMTTPDQLCESED